MFSYHLVVEYSKSLGSVKFPAYAADPYIARWACNVLLRDQTLAEVL